MAVNDRPAETTPEPEVREEGIDIPVEVFEPVLDNEERADSEYHTPRSRTISSSSLMDVDEPTDEEELAERLDALTFRHPEGEQQARGFDAPQPDLALINGPREWLTFGLAGYHVRREDDDDDEDMQYVLYNTDSIAGGHREDPTLLPLVDPEVYCVLCRTDEHLTHACMAPMPFWYRYGIIALVYKMCGRCARPHSWQECTTLMVCHHCHFPDHPSVLCTARRYVDPPPLLPDDY